MINKNIKLLLAVSMCIFTIGVYAENKLIYPPADNSKIYEYPPVNYGTTQQANTFVPRNPMNNPPFYNQPQQYAGYESMENNYYQSQMPMQNGMPMNTGNPYQYSNGFPFANNMPFSNGSNNSFNPFSGGNIPFANTSGNNFNPFAGNNMPFGNNSGNSFNPFSNGAMPFANNSNYPMNNMFSNNNNDMPFFGNSNNSNRKKAWGDKRNIWPDFYTDFTDEAWHTMSSTPRDLGRMPGGWRFPHISTPDPVTVSDAITNQFPPIAEEAGNMMDFSDWGVFDDK
ncbi:hypothetical protein GCM10009133_27770 [Cocleimonas flava]|nr:hypothetical protein [Cocleimonas flava]